MINKMLERTKGVCRWCGRHLLPEGVTFYAENNFWEDADVCICGADRHVVKKGSEVGVEYNKFTKICSDLQRAFSDLIKRANLTNEIKYAYYYKPEYKHEVASDTFKLEDTLWCNKIRFWKEFVVQFIMDSPTNLLLTHYQIKEIIQPYTKQLITMTDLAKSFGNVEISTIHIIDKKGALDDE